MVFLAFLIIFALKIREKRSLYTFWLKLHYYCTRLLLLFSFNFMIYALEVKEVLKLKLNVNRV